jgi:UPF0716 protein FxsA
MKLLIPIMIIFPALEIGVLLWSGFRLGVWNTVLLIMLTGILGVFFARKQGFEIMQNMRTALQNGHPPGEVLLDGFCVMMGGILLILPGFISDIMGFIFLLPSTRALVKPFLIKWLKNRAKRTTTFIIR